PLFFSGWSRCRFGRLDDAVTRGHSAAAHREQVKRRGCRLGTGCTLCSSLGGPDAALGVWMTQSQEVIPRRLTASKSNDVAADSAQAAPFVLLWVVQMPLWASG